MQFNPDVYAQIAGQNPQAAQAYLDSFRNAAPAASSAPQAQPDASAGYSNPAAAQPQAQLARGTLEDFYNQPTGGSAPSVTSKFFNKRPQGSWLQLEVLNDVTNADVRQQMTPQGQPQTFRDGKPKFVLVVKVKVTGSSDGTHPAEFPDGEATVWVKGVLADELRRAMTAAGDPSGYPKGGAVIVMQSAGEKASRTPGFSATKLFALQYAGPVGVAAEAIANPASQAAAPQAVSTPAVPVTASAPVPSPAPSVTAPAPGAAQATPAAPATAAEAPAVTFQAPAVTGAPAPAPEIGGDKAALLARLQGQG